LKSIFVKRKQSPKVCETAAIHRQYPPKSSAPPIAIRRSFVAAVSFVHRAIDDRPADQQRLFACGGSFVMNRDTRQSESGQQYGSYGSRIESNFLGIWGMCLAALQSDCQVQLLAEMFDNTIGLFLGHAASLIAINATSLVSIALLPEIDPV
jgi:hypothetical protein